MYFIVFKSIWLFNLIFFHPVYVYNSTFVAISISRTNKVFIYLSLSLPAIVATLDWDCEPSGDVVFLQHRPALCLSAWHRMEGENELLQISQDHPVFAYFKPPSKHGSSEYRQRHAKDFNKKLATCSGSVWEIVTLQKRLRLSGLGRSHDEQRVTRTHYFWQNDSSSYYY